MFELTNLLNFIPKPVATGLVFLVIGAGAFAGMEIRYMTVADFTKSYVLDLKGEIRELRDDLKDAQSESDRKRIQRDIDELLDELCYEKPEDSMCKARTAEA